MPELMLPLIDRYRATIQRGDLLDDPAQREVLSRFERLRQQLPTTAPLRRHWLLGWRRDGRSPRGLYLWGGVGRGKTLLMDLFYESLPDAARERLHFHRFMRHIHAELQRVGGQAEPLQLIARDLATRIRLLCLDEFDVIDIGDAMIIAGLLEALFDHGIVLVATSNLLPEQLYSSGIQRASFLPAIRLLEHHTEVVELRGVADYRRRVLESERRYHAPHSSSVEGLFATEVDRLAGDTVAHEGEMSLNGRQLNYYRRGNGVAWFDFEALCGPPRSQHDYIELARDHHTIFISAIPPLTDENQDKARRFVMLLDEFYDRRVKVVMSAALPCDQLYQGERLRFEFVRTLSRLQEMQSTDYLGRAHRG